MILSKSGLLTALGEFHEDLQIFRQGLNSVNALPVPDCDTGDNLFATVAAILKSQPKAGSDSRMVDLAVTDTFGNSGMLIAAWLGGAESALAEPVSIGEAATVAAVEVEQTIAHPLPGLFLDYSRSAAQSLSSLRPSASHESIATKADDLRMLLVDTASLSPDLNQLVDSGSAGLYLLIRRILGLAPDAAEHIIFESSGSEVSRGLDATESEAIVEFLFTAAGASRGQILSLLDELKMDSVMMGRGADLAIRVHCHGVQQLQNNLRSSLTDIADLRDFVVRRI
jgi:dihydroxyacetone kinase-like predicted kinase